MYFIFRYLEKVSTIIKNCNGLSDTGKEFVEEALRLDRFIY